MKRIESVTSSIWENIRPNREDDYIEWVEKVRAQETHVFSYPDIGKRGHSMVLIDINRNYGKGEGRLLIPQAVDALYHHINTYSPDWYCDRAFLPDDNLVKLMCTEGVSLISQGILSAKEAKRGRDFEIVGISITHPLQFFQMLKALELSGLTPTRNNRLDKEPLVILGGRRIS